MSDYGMDLSIPWQREYNRFCCDFGTDVVEGIMERCGLPFPVSSAYNDYDLDGYLEEFRRLHCVALDAQELLASVELLPVEREHINQLFAASGYGFNEEVLPRYAAACDSYNSRINRLYPCLIVLACECGLDVLEDALNSDVPLEDIVA